MEPVEANSVFYCLQTNFPKNKSLDDKILVFITEQIRVCKKVLESAIW